MVCKCFCYGKNVVYGADRPLCKKEYVNEIEKLFFRYIWNGNIFKPSFDTCCRSPESGGLGLIDPEKSAKLCFAGGGWLILSLWRTALARAGSEPLASFLEAKDKKQCLKNVISKNRL